MAQNETSLAIYVAAPDGSEITAVVMVRPKRLPLRPRPSDIVTTGEPVPESRPAKVIPLVARRAR